jgi:DNA primase
VTPRLQPDQFNIRNALARFDRVGDLFAPVLASTQEIEPALQKLSAHL